MAIWRHQAGWRHGDVSLVSRACHLRWRRLTPRLTTHHTLYPLDPDSSIVEGNPEVRRFPEEATHKVCVLAFLHLAVSEWTNRISAVHVRCTEFYDYDDELHDKPSHTPCLWQAPASTQKTTKRDAPRFTKRTSVWWRPLFAPYSSVLIKRSLRTAFHVFSALKKVFNRTGKNNEMSFFFFFSLFFW